MFVGHLLLYSNMIFWFKYIVLIQQTREFCPCNYHKNNAQSIKHDKIISGWIAACLYQAQVIIVTNKWEKRKKKNYTCLDLRTKKC